MIDVKGFCWEIYAHRSPPYRAWDSVASRGLCVGGKRKNLKPVTVLEQRTSQTRAGFSFGVGRACFSPLDSGATTSDEDVEGYKFHDGDTLLRVLFLQYEQGSHGDDR